MGRLLRGIDDVVYRRQCSGSLGAIGSDELAREIYNGTKPTQAQRQQLSGAMHRYVARHPEFALRGGRGRRISLVLASSPEPTPDAEASRVKRPPGRPKGSKDRQRRGRYSPRTRPNEINAVVAALRAASPGLVDPDALPWPTMARAAIRAFLGERKIPPNSST